MSGKYEPRYVPDRVTLVAAGRKEPRHPGYTLTEYDDLLTTQARRRRAVRIALGILGGVALLVGLFIMR